jgi:hypothetical protein
MFREANEDLPHDLGLELVHQAAPARPFDM